MSTEKQPSAHMTVWRGSRFVASFWDKQPRGAGGLFFFALPTKALFISSNHNALIADKYRRAASSHQNCLSLAPSSDINHQNCSARREHMRTMWPQRGHGESRQLWNGPEMRIMQNVFLSNDYISTWFKEDEAEPPLQTSADHLVKSNGKQLRLTFVFHGFPQTDQLPYAIDVTIIVWHVNQ